MFTSSFITKCINSLVAAALAGLVAFILGVTLDLSPVGSLVLTVSALLLAGALHDYAPRRAAWEPRQARARALRPPQSIRRVSALTAAA